MEIKKVKDPYHFIDYAGTNIIICKITFVWV